MKKLKKLKFTTVFVLVVAAAALGYLFVRAQTVTDSYNNDNLIAATWNISTSTSGEIKLAGKTCNVTDWFCSASTTCANYLGDGNYIIVAQGDAPSSKAWKTSATACDRPHCSIDGGQNGDNLKADNTLDFTDYPARDYCKSIGGRLPTIDELECIYNNRASFGSFGAGYYWSSTEYSETNARGVGFSSGSVLSNNKTSTYYVRCVFGW